MVNCKGGEMMTKYKHVEEKIDEALKLSKETGKEHGFSICQSGEEITATKVDRDFAGSENKCRGTKLGSFNFQPVSKDVPPSPKDISDIQPDIPKV
jgi:hypothetical protein